MTAVRPWAEVAAVLRYDDGASTPTFGDLEEAADLIEALAAQLAAVNAALDQYVRDCRDGKAIVATLDACVSAIAKAVGR